jgi:hypothetical protein
MKRGRALRQYFVDCDGSPLLTREGLPVHLLTDEEGEKIYDEDGNPILVPVEVPPGSAVGGC